MANETPKPKIDPEQQRQKKEEQARNTRRRSRQLIGLALAILIVVGAVSIVMNGVNLVQSMMQNDEEVEEYRSLFEPMVWFDLLPFDSVSQVDENSIKQIAIWGVMTQLGDSINRNDYGEPLVPASDVDRYGVRLFGPDFRFSGHASFADAAQDLTYRYDEETQTYTAPATGIWPAYLPTVVEIKRESGGVRRVVMGYVNTRTSDDQMVMTPDYDHPAKYMDYMLRRDGGEYYLYALVRNTTHVPELPTDTSTPATPAAPDSSLITSLPATGSSSLGAAASDGSNAEDNSDAEDSTGSNTDGNSNTEDDSASGDDSDSDGDSSSSDDGDDTDSRSNAA